MRFSSFFGKVCGIEREMCNFARFAKFPTSTQNGIFVIYNGLFGRYDFC
jgi:hypothetical protein